MICAIGLNLYLFTDFINFIEIQELNGWIMCGLVSFFMLINMIPIFANVLNQVIKVLKFFFIKFNNKLADRYPKIFSRISKKNFNLHLDKKSFD